MSRLQLRFLLLTALLGGFPLAMHFAFPERFGYVMEVQTYLVFHNVAEFFSVMVSLSIFGVAWYSYEQSKDRYSLFIGSIFLCVGLLDFMHTLAYTGMPDFITPNSPLKSTQYWLAARLYMALALFLSLFIQAERVQKLLTKPILILVNLGVLFLVFAGVTFFPEYVPITHIPGVGLTPFKTYSEYLVIGLLVLSFLGYWHHLAKTKDAWLVYLLAGLILSILSESQFASYQSVFDMHNIIGHIYKFAAFYMIYLGMFAHSVKQPYIGMLQVNERLQVEMADRMHAEAKQHESEEAYRATFEQAAVGIARIAPAGRWLEVNSKLCRILGYTEDELLKLSFQDITHVDDLESNLNSLQQLLVGTLSTYSIVKRYIHKSGQVVWVNLTMSLVRNYDGSPKYFIAVVEDINEKKQNEDQLHRLSLAVQQSSNVIIFTDLDANIEWVNAGFTRSTGYTLEEAKGKNPRIFQSGKTPQSTYNEMWEQLSAGKEWSGILFNRHKDGSEYVESTLISPVRQADGRVTNYLAIKENISEKILAEEKIQYLSHHDQLTGLPNRSLLDDRFSYALSLAQRSGEQFAVMFVDLDHFKEVNDALGHSIGDLMLKEIARRIVAALPEGGTASRLSGDAFILVLPGTNEHGAANIATKLLDEVSAPFKVEQYELICTASIGIAIYPYDGKDFETLSKNADAAMGRVKQGSRNSYIFFTAAMQANATRNLQLSNALRHALVRNELQLHYQPQVAMYDGHVIGAEALLRWQHPEFGMVSPAEFIPIAESSGQIIQIGEWVLRTAASQLKNWLDSGLPPMVIAVNLSAVQFHQANLLEMVTQVLDEVQLPHQYLELELTEAAAMDDPQAAVAIMDKLHTLGVRMSIDDFGTGYSSLSYLKRFQVYKLKIDQSFVHDISNDSDDKAIVTAIINMASSLGMQTIAEGVETADQLAFLRLQGCNEVQGYYFSKPLTAEQFVAYIRNREYAEVKV
ncbi:MAG: EAL domain-containing protein [Pseudomonadota bacterium]